MADRAITALVAATSMTNADLFAISQGGQAKKVTWEVFYTYLAEALDGHGGINSIEYTEPTSGSLEGTLTVTLADGTSEDFTITNGKGMVSIADKWAVSMSNTTEPITWYDNPPTMTPTNKYLWHYQIITFNDSSTIDTGKAVVGVYGDTGQDWHVFIKWSAEEPDADNDMKDTPDNWIGIYSGTASTAPTAYTAYTWFEYKGEKGDTGVSITSISLYSSTGLVDTYRVTFSDGSFTSFNVTNGSSIQSIAKTSTSGLTDTYTVTLTDGTTTTFQVVNGKGINSITEVDVTHAAGHTDVYRFNFNDGDTYQFSIYNGTNGSGSVSTVDNIQSVNQDVPLLILGQGAPTTSTAGALKQRYFDQTNSILYICVGIDTSGAETTYDWRGTGVTVDSALSSMSTNPVQNAVLTAIIGTATLNTTAQTLTQAVNELEAEKVENGVITEYVETTTTASRAYAIGDHILLNGVRYEVTAAISSGGTITVGTNVTERNVDDDLANLKNTLNSKVNTSAIVNNVTTESDGYVLDARQGKAVNDRAVTIADGLAYHKAGNTANTALSIGTYIYLTGNSTLPEGIYRVKSAISSGATYTTSNLTRQKSGASALNTLNSQSTIDSGSGYVKFPDGTMLQYGAATITASGTMQQIASSGIYAGAFAFTLPQAFISSSFRIFGSARYSTGYPFTFAGFPSASNKATLYVYDFYARPMNDGNMSIQWFAIGRWKA